MTERFTMEELLHQFEESRWYHEGRVSKAAEWLNRSPSGLSRQLYRARKAGYEVRFIDDSTAKR